MSFKVTQSQQLTLDDSFLDDSFLNLSPRTQKIVMNSWAEDFADIVFPAINKERFSVLYSDRKGKLQHKTCAVHVSSKMVVRAAYAKKVIHRGISDAFTQEKCYRRNTFGTAAQVPHR